MATHKSLSNRLRAGRGRRRFRTVNCCRSTKFSKMRSRRLRKMRRSDLNASQSTLSIIGVITEFWQPTAVYVIDFKDGQSFGEAQATNYGYSSESAIGQRAWEELDLPSGLRRESFQYIAR